MGKKINLRLDTPSNIRKSLSKVANMVLNGAIDTKTANTLTIVCNALLSSIRIDEQEKRIDELEMLLEEKKEG